MIRIFRDMRAEAFLLRATRHFLAITIVLVMCTYRVDYLKRNAQVMHICCSLQLFSLNEDRCHSTLTTQFLRLHHHKTHALCGGSCIKIQYTSHRVCPVLLELMRQWLSILNLLIHEDVIYEAKGSPRSSSLFEVTPTMFTLKRTGEISEPSGRSSFIILTSEVQGPTVSATFLFSSALPIHRVMQGWLQDSH